MTMAIDDQEQGNSSSNSLTPLQDECFKLYKDKQYKSCEILARMELSLAEQEGRDATIAWTLLGDCAHSTQQYSRAISCYRRIQMWYGSHKCSTVKQASTEHRFTQADMRPLMEEISSGVSEPRGNFSRSKTVAVACSNHSSFLA
mmetsp:Transcript_41263/g.99394  ORF Transcript_41263/g.99394 Transcript_41263/m.99394 type:complete len:145 (-) Transcript_41263:450-884(-)